MATSRHQMTSERFIEIVRKSELVDEVKLEKLVQKIRDLSDGCLPQSPRRIARVFQKRDLITKWHSEKLLAGKYRGFFIGRYKLLGHIGSGGMSSVYLAEHTGMGHLRAIKVLPKSRVADATYLARFKREAKAIASLSHPNIVAAYDIANEGDIHFIVMEFVDGLDLQQLVSRDGPLEFANAADIMAQSARGLQHAHGKGVIHRDIKPANLLVDENGLVRLLDMGLALMSGGDEQSLTVVNNENVLGTADYLAPEQALNSHGVDHRADIYALGCTMYFLLTGKPPFSDGTLAQRIARHQREMPKPVSHLRQDCPSEIEAIVDKMVRKDPQERFQSASDVALQFEQYLRTTPVSNKTKTRPAVMPNKIVSAAETGASSSGDSLSDLQATPSDIIRNEVAASSDPVLVPGDRGGLGATTDSKSGSKSDSDSFLDLQAESGYQPDSDIAKRLGLSKPEMPGGDSGHGSSFGLSNDKLTPLDRGGDSGRSFNRPLGRFDVDRMVWLIAATLFFVLAASFGFILARITSS